MIKRFQGEAGLEAAKVVLLKNTIVSNQIDVANRLISKGKILQIKTTDVIIEQGDCTDDVYFILAGSFDLLVNNSIIGKRGAGQHIGEMSALAPHLPRSATLKAKEPSVVLKVSKAIFLETVMSNEQSLKGAILTLIERLNNRNDLVKPRNTRPKIFIISSAEMVNIARGIEGMLSYDPYEVIVWTERTFEPSGYPLTSLEAQISTCDFCIAIATPDDVLHRRGSEHKVARDNVIFEAGMGVGALGVSRTFIVVPRDNKPTLPTDLVGLTTIDYASTSGSPALGPVCTQLRTVINKIGVR